MFENWNRERIELFYPGISQSSFEPKIEWVNNNLSGILFLPCS